MSRPRFLKIFLQINIFSVFSILPLTVHAQGTVSVLQQSARQPTAQLLAALNLTRDFTSSQRGAA